MSELISREGDLKVLTNNSNPEMDFILADKHEEVLFGFKEDEIEDIRRLLEAVEE